MASERKWKRTTFYACIRLSGKYLNTTSIYVFRSAFKMCVHFIFCHFFSSLSFSHFDFLTRFYSSFSVHLKIFWICVNGNKHAEMWIHRLLFGWNTESLIQCIALYANSRFNTNFALYESVNMVRSKAQAQSPLPWPTLNHYHGTHTHTVTQQSIGLEKYILYLFLYSVHSGTMNSDVMRKTRAEKEVFGKNSIIKFILHADWTKARWWRRHCNLFLVFLALA